MKILAFGEVLWDVYPDKVYIGGAPFNFAAHLAKHGEEVYLLSAVGDDSLGEDTRKAVKRFGISDEYVSEVVSKKTGQCLVTLDERSVPSYNLLNDVSYDYISCDRVVGEFDLLYFGTLALRSRYNLSALKTLLSKKHFADIFVDLNIRAPHYSKENVLFAISNATILKISDEELGIVAEQVNLESNDLKKFFCGLSERFSNLRCIIITLGSKGVYAFLPENKTEEQCDSEKVNVASTVGAGDSFSAAFVHKFNKGNTLEECLKYASRVAGFVVSNPEAVPDYNIIDFE